MTLKAIFEAWGPAIATPALLLFLTLIEITPIKLNPWSAIMRFLGSRLNANVTARLDALQQCQTETQEKLNAHIEKDDERDASRLRIQILRFNDEIMYKDRHTKEHFDEMLGVIHDYEAFCRTHEDYPNGKCVHAIANINRVYDELLEKNDFL